MTANPYRPQGRVDVKNLIEEMREEVAIERGQKYKKPVDKPKGKPKSPSQPYPKRPLKPKRKNIFAKKWVKKVNKK